MNNATIIVGPPGTGKTTELLNLVDSYLAKGIDPMKIGFISFTKKSINEAVDRACKRFGKDKRFFHYFRTIHSLAFYQLGMTKADVIEKKHYCEIGDKLGVIIKGKSAQDYAIEDLDKGDQLVFLEALSRMRCETLKDTYNREESLDFSYYELKLYKDTLDQYKSVNILNDFTDMLTKFYNQGDMPELEALFVDEAQDLCLLQWKIIEALSKNSKKTYIAGDDDQAIFRWSGADIEYFIELAKHNETRVLSQSYRVPSIVHKLSIELVSQINNRVAKAYKPTTHAGSVDWVVSIEDIDFSEGKWLLLVRNQYMVNPIIEYLRVCGYSYSSRFKSTQDIDCLQAALTWEKLRAGKEVSASEVKDMIVFASQKQISNPKAMSSIKGDRTVTMSDLVNLLGIKNSKAIWYDALDKVSAEDREYFIMARRKGESLIKEPRIHVSTIHGAKGGEEDNVVVFTDMTAKTYNKMLSDYEDEIRVFYVATTRARKNLYIVQSNSPYYFTI